MTVAPPPVPRHAAPESLADLDPITEPIHVPAARVPAHDRRPGQQPLPTQVVPSEVSPGSTVGLAIKRRHPVAAWIGLPLLTLGVYHFVWYYMIHQEMAEFDRRRYQPVMGPLLVILLLPVLTLGIAPLVSYYNTGHRIADAQRAAGLRPTCKAGIGLLLCFALGLHTLYYQSELNKIADAYGVPAGTHVFLRG